MQFHGYMGFLALALALLHPLLLNVEGVRRVHDGTEQGFVMIAGGTGIVPMRSMLLTMKDREDRRHVVLIYAAHDPLRMPFRDEFLAAVFVLFAVLFAWTATRDDSEENGSLAVEEAPRAAAEPGGAALYDAYCARCHPVETLGVPLSQARYRELQAFLRKHGKSSDDEDRLILDYLAGR